MNPGAAGLPAVVGGPSVNVLVTDPRVILFFLAVLPQFVGEAESTTAQLAMLGVVNVLIEVPLYGAIGMLAGAFQARFADSRRGNAVLHTIAGMVYTSLAGVVLVEAVACGCSRSDWTGHLRSRTLGPSAAAWPLRNLLRP